MPAPDWQKLTDANFADARSFAQRLSDAAKYAWVGAFALLYAAMLADSGALKTFYMHWKWVLLAAAVLGAISFVCDLAKNVVGLRFAARLDSWIRTELAEDPARPAGQQRMNDYAAYNNLIAGACAPAVSDACLWLSVLAAGASAILIALAFLLAILGGGR
ncbi:MAG: hypothetical protein ACREFO_11035 [Acetobacteraceae bacterium]